MRIILDKIVWSMVFVFGKMDDVFMDVCAPLIDSTTVRPRSGHIVRAIKIRYEGRRPS